MKEIIFCSSNFFLAWKEKEIMEKKWVPQHFLSVEMLIYFNFSEFKMWYENLENDE